MDLESGLPWWLINDGLMKEYHIRTATDNRVIAGGEDEEFRDLYTGKPSGNEKIFAFNR